MADPTEVVNYIKTRLRVLTAGVAVLAIGSVGLALYTFNIADKNTTALCSIKHSAELDIAQSRDFLEHPNQFGPAFAAIPRSFIEQDLEDQQTTVRSLGDIDCD